MLNFDRSLSVGALPWTPLAELSALPGPPSWFKGRGEGKGMGGTVPPFANSWIRPWYVWVLCVIEGGRVCVAEWPCSVYLRIPVDTLPAWSPMPTAMSALACRQNNSWLLGCMQCSISGEGCAPTVADHPLKSTIGSRWLKKHIFNMWSRVIRSYVNFTRMHSAHDVCLKFKEKAV